MHQTGTGREIGKACIAGNGNDDVDGFFCWVNPPGLDGKYSSIAFLFATMASAKKNPKDWQLHHARQLAGLQAFLDEEPKAGFFRGSTWKLWKRFCW